MITEHDQKLVTSILTKFMFAKDIDEVVKIWNEIFKEYELWHDPFTGCPCCFDEYSKNSLEYDKQKMIEKYGHCDGLER